MFFFGIHPSFPQKKHPPTPLLESQEESSTIFMNIIFIFKILKIKQPKKQLNFKKAAKMNQYLIMER